LTKVAEARCCECSYQPLKVGRALVAKRPRSLYARRIASRESSWLSHGRPAISRASSTARCAARDFQVKRAGFAARRRLRSDLCSSTSVN
jgi:hypothetical protein